MADLEQLNIVITGESSKAVSALDRLISKLNEVKSTMGDLGASGSIKNSIGGTAAKLSEVATEARRASDSLNGTSVEASRTAKNLSDIGVSAKNTKSELEGTSTSAKKTGKALGVADTKLEKFLKTVKRVAMMRAIRWALRELAQSVKEGLDIFIEWDRTYNNGMAGAAKTSDQLAAKWREVKKAIGAAVMPIIQALQPALEWIMNRVIDLANFVQQVVRALKGEAYWYRAVYKEAKKTTDQGKELRRVLFGFDELNILPSASGTGSADEIGKWEYKLEKIPDTMTLIKKGALILGGVLGTAGLLGVIKRLIRGIGDKNSALGDEATQTATDVAKSLALSGALGAVLGSAKALKDYLEKNPSNVQINVPAVDFSEQQAAVEEWQEWCDSNAIELGLKIRADYEASMKAGLNANAIATAAASSAQAVVPVTADTSGIGTAILNALQTTQQFLNKNPLSVAIKMGNSVTGKGDTKKYSPTAKNTLSTVNTISSAFMSSAFQLGKASKKSSNPWEGMSATDLTNWAESNGLANFMTDEDKKVAALTAAGVAALPIAAVGGALSGATAGAGGLLKLLPALLGFASGGDPDMGSLFWAGESGAEIVANTPSGTGVMNMKQMQDAVSNGNVQVVNAIGAMTNVIARAIADKDTNAYLDGQKITDTVIRRANGMAKATGRAVLSY